MAARPGHSCEHRTRPGEKGRRGTRARAGADRRGIDRADAGEHRSHAVLGHHPRAPAYRHATGEAASLQRGDLDFKAATIRVRSEVSKTRQSRLIPMDEAIAPMLRERAERVGREDYIFGDGSDYRRPFSGWGKRVAAVVKAMPEGERLDPARHSPHGRHPALRGGDRRAHGRGFAGPHHRRAPGRSRHIQSSADARTTTAGAAGLGGETCRACRSRRGRATKLTPARRS